MNERTRPAELAEIEKYRGCDGTVERPGAAMPVTKGGMQARKQALRDGRLTVDRGPDAAELAAVEKAKADAAESEAADKDAVEQAKAEAADAEIKSANAQTADAELLE